MLYSQGEYVCYKKYIGKIHFTISENKTYIVTLYNYRGFSEIEKQIDERDLYQFEQLCIEGT